MLDTKKSKTTNSKLSALFNSVGQKSKKSKGAKTEKSIISSTKSNTDNKKLDISTLPLPEDLPEKNTTILNERDAFKIIQENS